MSDELILALLEYIEEQIAQAEGQIELNRWVVTHTYVVMGYVLSMRGPEGFLSAAAVPSARGLRNIAVVASLHVNPKF